MTAAALISSLSAVTKATIRMSRIIMLTLAEAAQRLGLAHATLRVQIRNGKLRAKLYGNTYLVSEREVERYRRENKRQL